MRYRLSRRNIVVTVFFSILVALFLNACSDTNNVTGPPEPVPLSPDAKLSSLTVNTGPLDPAFSSDIRDYTVNVATSVTSVTVTARPQNASASMTINGQATPSGQARTVTLGGAGSSTPIPIVVTAVNGSQNTYIVTVSRAAPGGNNNLQSLTVSPGPLTPAFTASTTSYSVSVASSVNSVTVTATLQDTNASMTINGQGASSGQARSITLNGPGSSTLITIEVTAPNGSQKTYTVTVNRTALGGNNNLQGLTVSPGSLAPAFTASTTSYTVDVVTSVTGATVTARAQDAGATVSINGQPTTSRSVSLGAAGSSTPISIEVTAPNGSQKTYIVTVNRAAPGGNNNLQSLAVSPGPLAPVFNANTLNYSVDVGSGVGSATVTATLQDTNASMEVNGQGTSSGQVRTITLNGPGSSSLVRIEVTAPNGSPKTYLVTVNRMALGGNNNLQSLTVSPGPLAPPFTASTTSYSVDVASTAPSVTVTATLQDTNASMEVNGQGTSSGQARTITLNEPGSSTLITIEVTAPNGSQKTYAVSVNRAALGGNNNLQSLTISPGTLTPSFTVSRLIYTVSVASSVDSVTVTAQPQDSGATVSIDGQPTTSRSVSLGAAGSSTEIQIEVTAPNGNQKTYAVTVNRAAFVPSGNNNLSDLVVSAGPLDSTFDAATTSYNVQTSILTENTTVTATVADSTATLTINGSPATSGAASASILLDPLMPTTIPIVVTAENGAQKPYTITVTRSIP